MPREGVARFDFFRKVHDDYTQGTISGATFSLLGALVLVLLFFMELVRVCARVCVWWSSPRGPRGIPMCVRVCV
jgi:hypothetical protein